MIKRLVSRRADALVDMGRTILARLEVDPRLAESAGSMKATQSGLEPKVDALDAARSAERLARVQRDEDRRLLASQVREFGFMLLSGNGNHHNAAPYLKYFPDGYGELAQLQSGALGEFGRLILAKFAQETDPKILAQRDLVEQALNRFLATEDAYQAARRARNEAFALVQAEKRNWTRGVIKARSLAESECHFERAYVRSIFIPIAMPKPAVTNEESGTVETPAPVASVPPALHAPAAVVETPQEAAA